MPVGFQGFGQPVKLAPAVPKAPQAGPKPVLPNPQSPGAGKDLKGFVPKSPGSSGCPICR